MPRDSVTGRSHHPPPIVEAIAQRRLPDVIAEQIVDAIRQGVLAAGDRLPTEQELARQLRVGRTSVREGLQKLQTLGIIEVVKGRGAFVCEPGSEDAHHTFARWSAEHQFAIEDLAEVRMALETVAVGLAAVRASEAQVVELERLHERHRDAAAAGDLGEIVRTDERFHEGLMQASGNPLLAKMYGILVAEIMDFRRKTLALPRAAQRSAERHGAIVEAIRRQDAFAAREALVDHLYVVYEEIEAAATTGDGAAGRMAPREALV